MAIIKLTRGFETIVDDDLFEELNSYRWYASGIDGRPARRLKTEGRRLICIYHQILDVFPWLLRLEGKCVDHINTDPLNNTRKNLRIVTWKENTRNKFAGRQGIGFDGTNNRYKVYIDQDDQPRINVGTFKTKPEAEIALANAKKELGLEDS